MLWKSVFLTCAKKRFDLVVVNGLLILVLLMFDVKFILLLAKMALRRDQS
jgi:hypothetical protein